MSETNPRNPKQELDAYESEAQARTRRDAEAGRARAADETERMVQWFRDNPEHLDKPDPGVVGSATGDGRRKRQALDQAQHYERLVSRYTSKAAGAKLIRDHQEHAQWQAATAWASKRRKFYERAVAMLEATEGLAPDPQLVARDLQWRQARETALKERDAARVAEAAATFAKLEESSRAQERARQAAAQVQPEPGREATDVGREARNRDGGGGYEM